MPLIGGTLTPAPRWSTSVTLKFRHLRGKDAVTDFPVTSKCEKVRADARPEEPSHTPQPASRRMWTRNLRLRSRRPGQRSWPRPDALKPHQMILFPSKPLSAPRALKSEELAHTPLPTSLDQQQPSHPGPGRASGSGQGRAGQARRELAGVAAKTQMAFPACQGARVEEKKRGWS